MLFWYLRRIHGKRVVRFFEVASVRIKEEFKKSGYFWLPSEPEIKVQGILSIADGGNVELETLEWPDRVLNVNDRVKRIVGQIENDVSVSLDDCFFYGYSVGDYGIKLFFLIDGKTFIGTTCDEDENILLSNLTFSVEGIEEWVGISGIKVDNNNIISYSKPEEILFNLNNGMRLIIEFKSEIFRSSTSPPSVITEVKVTQKIYFKLVSLEKREVNDFTAIAEKITTLLCIATDQIVCLKDISATIIDDNAIVQPISVEIYYRSRPYSQKKPIITKLRMLFRYQDIQNYFEQVVDDWIEANNRSNFAFRSYFLAKTDGQKYLEGKFWVLAQTLEIYHRSLLSTDSRRNSSGKKIKFEQRLKELIEPFKDFVGTDEEIKTIVHKIGATRNFLTHRDVAPESLEYLIKSEEKPQEFVCFYYKMEAILQLNFLQDLSFTPEEIKSIFDDNDQLKEKLKKIE